MLIFGGFFLAVMAMFLVTTFTGGLISIIFPRPRKKRRRIYHTGYNIENYIDIAHYIKYQKNG